MLTIQKFPKTVENPIGFVQILPDKYVTSKKYPVIIFFHGDGQQGGGTESELQTYLQSYDLDSLVKSLGITWQINNEEYQFIALMPQMTGSQGGWTFFQPDYMIGYAENQLSIDKDRIYLAALSRGGNAIWEYMTHSKESAEKIAAVVTCCTVSSPVNADFCLMKNIPIWSFHAKDDQQVSHLHTDTVIEKISTCKPVVPPRYTKYFTGGHTIWNRVFHPVERPDNNYVDSVYTWMLSHKRGQPAPPAPIILPTLPVTSPSSGGDVIEAITGGDVSISSQASYTLDASKSKGKFNGVYWQLEKTIPEEVQWQRPPSKTWFAPMGRLDLTDLQPGTKYFFRLDIPNLQGKIVDSDHMTLTVEPYITTLPASIGKYIVNANVKDILNNGIIAKEVVITYSDGTVSVIK